MSKIKYVKGSYKYTIKPLEALSGHTLRMSYGGTGYGLPITTVANFNWTNSSEEDAGDVELGSRVKLRSEEATYSLRAETAHTNVPHSDSHTDGHTNTYSDWGNVPSWGNSGVAHSDVPAGRVWYYYDYSDAKRSENLQDWVFDDPWTDAGKTSYSVPYAGDGHGNYSDIGYGEYNTGIAHYNYTDHNDTHGNWTNYVPHVDINHTNWYDSLKEAI